MLIKDLYDYQDPAVDQFLSRGNLLVAFAMGLGKTPIGIACAEELLGCGDIGLCLVVCESSLKYQWAQAIAKFTDVPKRQMTLRIDGKPQTITIPAATHCAVIDGKPFQRDKVKYSAADDRKRQYEAIGSKCDYVIISYDSVVDDQRAVRKLIRNHDTLVILDEATAIKTFEAERTIVTKQILDAPYRLALTGTPVDNKPEELFSIMQWVDSEVLGRWDFFDTTFIVRDPETGRPRRYRHLDVLRERIRPAMARISHDDKRVAAFIPKALSSELYVTPSPDLLAAYTEIALDLLSALRRLQRRGGFDLAAYYSGQKQDENSAAGQVMARLTALDMLLAHPDILIQSAQQFEDSAWRRKAGEVRKNWPGSAYAYGLWQAGLVDNVFDAPKLERLAKRVPEILAEDDRYKVMIYTRWPGMLPYMADAVSVPHVQYHGGMNARAKAAAQARFTQDPKTRLFLSSFAGARGVDLFVGSHLLKYDLPWAAGLGDQIDGRHVRASSEFKEVWIENLITKGTTEEWKLAVVNLKREVGSAILDGKGRTEIRADGNGLTAFLESTLESLT